jgi:hypothetical protein
MPHTVSPSSQNAMEALRMTLEVQEKHLEPTETRTHESEAYKRQWKAYKVENLTQRDGPIALIGSARNSLEMLPIPWRGRATIYERRWRR